MGTDPASGQLLFTSSGLALGLSILFMATMIGTPAALACAMASRVCGITPSSTATHQHRHVRHLCTARAHGRERLVAGGIQEGHPFALVLHLVGADMLCDATASPAATFVLRIASSSNVLPWSTSPITVVHRRPMLLHIGRLARQQTLAQGGRLGRH